MTNVKENRKKWIAALRSGEYKQGKGFLVDDGNHCCLGVLCSVYERETGKELPRTSSRYYYDVSEETLADFPQVQEWVGLSDAEGRFEFRVGVPHKRLTTLNDDSPEYDFSKLADLIESEPRGLFK
jgi:hypothetical protein